MIRKEITEIKKFFSKDKGVIKRVAGCYINNEKAKVTTLNEAFYAIPEEEEFKYYEIFKKTLSGGMNKNILNFDFTRDEELNDESMHSLLMKLRKAELKDETLLDEFYDNIIDCYDYINNYLILVSYGIYDIPGKSNDGMTMNDASDEVYDFILCSLCPVELSKAGLCYNPSQNAIKECVRDWMVQTPDTGFLFPAFTDRRTDIHSMLFYSKKPNQIHMELNTNLFKCEMPVRAHDQREIFTQIIESSAPECTIEDVKEIQTKICDKINLSNEEPEQIMISKREISEILPENLVVDEEVYEKIYESTIESKKDLNAANIMDLNKLEIINANVKVSVSSKDGHLVSIKEVDGRKSLVIMLEGETEVNGIRIK